MNIIHSKNKTACLVTKFKGKKIISLDDGINNIHFVFKNKTQINELILELEKIK